MLLLPLYDDAPLVRTPVLTYGLIAACSVVFLWQNGLSTHAADNVAFAYGFVPAVFFGHAHLPARLHALPPWITLFSSMFLHGGWLHLLGNMLYLWLFGKGVESALGPARFLLLYFACGAVAGLTQGLMNVSADVPMIGASGAIAGVLGAYLVIYPRGNVTVFFWILIFVRLIAVPAVIVLGAWFLMQLLSALGAEAGEGGVAFWAHVGGFIAGMALTFVFRPRHISLWQPARSQSFAMARPSRIGRGSVPSAGSPRFRRNPWN
jgi:membrane associated rhomboid family serine protease